MGNWRQPPVLPPAGTAGGHRQGLPPIRRTTSRASGAKASSNRTSRTCPESNELIDEQECLTCEKYRHWPEGANGEPDWPGSHVIASIYTEIKKPAYKYVFLEDIDPRGTNVGSWQIAFGPPGFIDPVAMWHNERTTLGYADGHSEMHRWHDINFIGWSQEAMYEPTTFTFNMTPPDDERQDLEFLAQGFPCKSHD
jgi:prepilin-type processing-associated H-X9-DG protein